MFRAVDGHVRAGGGHFLARRFDEKSSLFYIFFS